MEQIRIPEGISDKLKGKTIEKTSFYVDMDDSDENHLVITFTDGTYISVAIDYDDDYYLSNCIPSLDVYNANTLGYISDGKFHCHTPMDIPAGFPSLRSFLKIPWLLCSY